MRTNINQLKPIIDFYDKMVTGFSLMIPEDNYLGGLSSLSYATLLKASQMMSAGGGTITSTGATSANLKSKKQSFLDTLNEFKFGEDEDPFV